MGILLVVDAAETPNTFFVPIPSKQHNSNKARGKTRNGNCGQIKVLKSDNVYHNRPMNYKTCDLQKNTTFLWAFLSCTYP